ncbi:hypothetical protein K523DRAFT_142606 [Schizophyllum commune Tattone D]|nr:hypothetical protein K523DRAFT_142606 [Schizophyllum commune Tattone D]
MLSLRLSFTSVCSPAPSPRLASRFHRDRLFRRSDARSGLPHGRREVSYTTLTTSEPMIELLRDLAQRMDNELLTPVLPKLCHGVTPIPQCVLMLRRRCLGFI